MKTGPKSFLASFLASFVWFAVVAALPLSACAQETPETVKVVTSGGTHAFAVEIADDDAERARGLMFRETLPQDQGMLFLFPDSAERSFWMHNTPLPLDIIYISAKGEVVSIQKNAIPYDRTPLPSYGPAAAVLEINGGLSDRLGIRPGDRVETRLPLQADQ